MNNAGDGTGMKDAVEERGLVLELTALVLFA